MIFDQDQIVISVTTDNTIVEADVSVSIELVVTELVINALKHAFSGGRHGNIGVDYCTKGNNWKLSVTDNGVGMATIAGEAKAGLGTNIVKALAKQLDAKITVRDRKPGTDVSLDHVAPPIDVANDAVPKTSAI